MRNLSHQFENRAKLERVTKLSSATCSHSIFFSKSFSKALTMVATIQLDTSPELCPAEVGLDKAGRKRQRKLVCFNDRIDYRHTYCIDEVKDCWYSNQEFDAIKTDVQETVSLMRRCCHIDDVNYCRRGLEWFVDDATAKIEFENQTRAFLTVMDRQAMDKGCQDFATLADSIAHDYADEARNSKMRAYLTGIADERYAMSMTVSVEEPSQRAKSS